MQRDVNRWRRRGSASRPARRPGPAPAWKSRRVVRHDAHLEGLRALDHLAADTAETDDASVLPRSSWPMSFFFSHLPARVEAVACGIRRAMASISARVCSATETALPPGVFMTSTPASVAASRSTLSTPTPARPMTRSLGAFSSTAAFTCTALRTRSASASGRYWAYSLGWKRWYSNRAGTEITRFPPERGARQ